MSDASLWQVETDLRRLERSAFIDAVELGRLEAACACALDDSPSAGVRSAVAGLRRRLTGQRHRLHGADFDGGAHRISGLEALVAQGCGLGLDPGAQESCVPTCLDGVDPRTWCAWRDAVRAGYSTRACLGRAHARGEGSVDDVLACEEALACLIGAHPVRPVRVLTQRFTRWSVSSCDPRTRSWQYLIGYTGATYALGDPTRAVVSMPASARLWMSHVDESAEVSSASAADLLA